MLVAVVVMLVFVLGAMKFVVVVVVFAEKAMTAVFVVAMAIANLADCTRDNITYSDMVLARKDADSLL